MPCCKGSNCGIKLVNYDGKSMFLWYPFGAQGSYCGGLPTNYEDHVSAHTTSTYGHSNLVALLCGSARGEQIEGFFEVLIECPSLCSTHVVDK